MVKQIVGIVLLFVVVLFIAVIHLVELVLPKSWIDDITQLKK